MANIKSAKKRNKITLKKTLRNKIVKSTTKTALKKAVVALQAGDKAAAKLPVKDAIKAIDVAYGKGIFHKNAAARKKSTLQRLYNAL